MEKIRSEKELQEAINAGLKAKEKIMEFYNKGFDVEIKEDNSPVTNADKAADKIIREYLHKVFPTHAFLTEESRVSLNSKPKELKVIRLKSYQGYLKAGQRGVRFR